MSPDFQKQVSERFQKNSSDVSNGLRDLFVDELKDIYWAEKTLTKAIPKMMENATSSHLVEALTAHLSDTKTQVIRLEKIFAVIGEQAEAKTCEAMVGLVKEAEEIMKSTQKGMVRDAGIISAGQKVEHYEIATYGTLCSFARALGLTEAAELLQTSLNEEKAANAKLTEIAVTSINEGAIQQTAH